MPGPGGSSRRPISGCPTTSRSACSPGCSRPTWSTESSKSPGAPSSASVCCRPVSSSTTCSVSRFSASVRTKRSCACWSRVSRGKKAGPTRGTCRPRRRSSRRGLGSGPSRVEALYRDCAVPLATKRTKGAFYKSWRLMGIDGTCLDVADTRPTRRPSVGPAPSVRTVQVPFPRSGSSASPSAAPTPSSTPSSAGTPTPSRRLVPALFGSFVPGMLVLADRGFFSFDLWKTSPRNRSRSVVADQVQPRLGRRAASSRRLVPLVDLPEPKGPPQPHQRRRGCASSSTTSKAAPASHGDEDTTYRLLTTILDPKRAPAASSLPSTPNAGSSRPRSTSSRPTNEVHAWCCAPRCPTASPRRPTDTSACTTPSAGSCTRSPKAHEPIPTV